MTIYRISHNIDDFMFFTIDDMDVYDKMEDFNIDGFGQPLAFNWVAPNAEFLPSDSGGEVKPDITQWNGTDLILSQQAKQLLEDKLAHLGEFLELSGACKDYSFFNPTTRIGNDIINLNKTKSVYFDDGSWNKLEKLVFNAQAETDSPLLFTLEIDQGINLYCTEEFKIFLEENGLQGLLFEEIESSD